MQFCNMAINFYDLNQNDITFLKALGNNIKSLRIQKKMLQEVLAIKSEISRNQIGLIEKGTANVKIITLKKIAEALETDLNSIIDI